MFCSAQSPCLPARLAHGPRACNFLIHKTSTSALLLHSALVSRASHADGASSSDGQGPSAASAIAAAAAASLLMAAQPANAYETERVWKPRRHTRRLGERYTEAWAEEVVEKEEQGRAAQRLEQERLAALQQKKHEMEAAAKQAFDQAVAQAAAIKESALQKTVDESGFSLRVLGAELAGPLTWILLFGTVFALFRADVLLQMLGRKPAQRRGRWVYDRSLGGKKVFIPEGQEVNGFQYSDSPLSPLKDRDFERLAGIAAAASTAASITAAAPEPREFQMPAWWDPAPVLYASEETKDFKRAQAERILARLEQGKNVGQDYSPQDLLALRRTCQEGNVSVKPKTVGGAQAMYRAGVEAAIRAAMDPADLASSLGGVAPRRLIAGLADDLQIDERKALGIVTSCMAATARGRIIEAITARKAGSNAEEALVSLMRLASAMDTIPALQPGSPEIELIASSLRDVSRVEERAGIFLLFGQIYPEGAEVMALLLGFDPAQVQPQLVALLAQQREQQLQQASAAGGEVET